MSDNENDWGNKKQQYYAMNRNDKEDTDYIEEEKEAIRLQKKRLAKLKASNLMQSSDDEDNEIENINESSKKPEGDNAVKINELPIENIVENLHTIHDLIEESEEDLKDTIEILQDEKIDIGITLDYLNWKKDINILYALLLAYTSYAKLNNKMTNHHPSIKKLGIIKYIISSSQKSNEIVDKNTDAILELIETKNIKNKHSKRTESSKILQKKTKRTEFTQDDDDDYDDFIKKNVANVAKMKEDNKNKEVKEKNRIAKEVEFKNQFGIRKANKEVLKARGIYRKRKQYLGNAKVANREKFYKKEKQRKKMVKEYEGKPDVYGGEATGIRRDIIRSTMIKS